MKKLFMMAALVMALIFAGCPTDAGDSVGNGENINGGGDTTSDTKKLKARNESSVTINGVKWNDETFTDGTNTMLAPGSTFTCVVSNDKAVDGTGFIYFNKADLSCRTQTIVSFTDVDTFVFTDNTVVIDMSDTTNTGTLVNIAKRMNTPTAPTLTAGSGRLTVSWEAVDLAVSYNIYHSTSSTAPETPTQTNITTTSAVITGLTNDTPYYVWVQAVNAGGALALSPSASKTLTLGAPTAPTLTAGDGRLTVSWTAVDTADSYKVYHSASSTPPEMPTQIDITGTSTVITDLINDTPYYVWVQAVNAGGTSALSQRATGTPMVPIGDITYTGSWTLQSDGRYKSNAIAMGGQTMMRINFTATAGATLTIQLDVSSMPDYRNASIAQLDSSDSTAYYNSRISGDKTIIVDIPVPTAGSHFVNVWYIKGTGSYSTGSSGSDCAWFKVLN
jgi:fibronectin type 3 domain-containing protein